MASAAHEAPPPQLLALVEEIFGDGQGARCTRLEAGWSNRVYRVRRGDAEIVVRLPGEGDAVAITVREREAHAWRLAAAARLAPEPLLLDPARGILVTPLVAEQDLGAHLGSRAPAPALLDALGELLARFHALDATPVPAVDLLGSLDADLALAVDAALADAALLRAARAQVPDLATTAFVHHDLNPANVLVGARLWIVDLETAGPGDPELDLLTLSLCLDLTGRAERRLFAAAGSATPHAARRHGLATLFQLREFAWAARRIAAGRREAPILRQSEAALAELSRSVRRR